MKFLSMSAKACSRMYATGSVYKPIRGDMVMILSANDKACSPARAAPQLVVNATGFVSLSANDHESA